MLTYDAIGSYVLVLTLATIFVVILLLRQNRTGRDVQVWLFSGLIGILLGAAGSIAAAQLLGYNLARFRPAPPVATIGAPPNAPTEAGAGAPEMGGSPAGPGSPSGAGGAGGGNAPKRQLMTLVRKLELLTGEIALDLSGEQGMQLAGILRRIQAQESMSDEEATGLHDELLAVLTESQRAKQDLVGLPRPPRGAGGPRGPDSGPPDDPDANPFAQEPNAAAVEALLDRFGPAESPPADQPPADQPAAESPPADQPAAESPPADQPAAESPPADQPAAESPAAESPAAESPAAESPAAESPAAESPAAEAANESPPKSP
jgi:hypothetical protein